MPKKSQPSPASASSQDVREKKVVWNDKWTEEFIDICTGELKLVIAQEDILIG